MHRAPWKNSLWLNGLPCLICSNKKYKKYPTFKILRLFRSQSYLNYHGTRRWGAFFLDYKHIAPFCVADKVMPAECSLKLDPGPCKALFPRFFYNISSARCEKFNYGGCKGNSNRFRNEEACKTKCRCEYQLSPFFLSQSNFLVSIELVNQRVLASHQSLI